MTHSILASALAALAFLLPPLTVHTLRFDAAPPTLGVMFDQLGAPTALAKHAAPSSTQLGMHAFFYRTGISGTWLGDAPGSLMPGVSPRNWSSVAAGALTGTPATTSGGTGTDWQRLRPLAVTTPDITGSEGALAFTGLFLLAGFVSMKKRPLDC